MSKRRRLPNNNASDGVEEEANIEIDDIEKEEEARINEIINLLGDELDFDNSVDVDSIPLSEYRRKSTSVNQRTVYFSVFCALIVFMIWVNYYNYRQLERIKEEYGPEKKVEPEMWWQKSLIYHVYVRSFKDSDGDGVGDITGLIQHLDHFIYIGVDALLISDIFESPMKDLGRDVSNFTNIDPLYGTLDTYTHLLKEAHDKGIKIILELVPNHTSKKMKWFIESRRGGKSNKYKDYYVWAKGRQLANGTILPPNNWLSIYGGSAWTYDSEREMFYYHKFHTSMPDLNHRSARVQDEIVKMIQFWVRTGLDGLFFGNVHLYFEADDVSLDEPLSDVKGMEPGEYGYLEHQYTEDHAEIHDFLANWKEALDNAAAEKKRRLPMIIDMDNEQITDVVKYFFTGGDSVTVKQLMKIDDVCGGYCVQELIEVVKLHLPDEREPVWMYASPDTRRMSSVKGPQYQNVLNMLLLLLPGAARTYYGEEIGLPEVDLDYKDTVDIKGKLAGIKFKQYTRDYSRAPMPWTKDHNYGFTRAEKPWLAFAEITEEIAIESQKNNPSGDTPMHLYGKLARLRKEHSFMFGEMQYSIITEELFSFMRFAKNSAPYLIILNFGDVAATKDYTPSAGVQYGKLVAHAKPNGYRGPRRFLEGKMVNLDNVTLQPGEGIVVVLLMDMVLS